MSEAVPTFAELTTMRVGGPAPHLTVATTEAELVAIAADAYASGEPVLLLGGGSNTVVADEGFDGTVIRIATAGVKRVQAGDGGSGHPDAVRLRVQAGENWDTLVAFAVRNRWAGIEALSGIPGSAGAAPVQNIGAYGQELSSVLVAVDFLDAVTGDVRRLTAADLEADVADRRHGRLPSREQVRPAAGVRHREVFDGECGFVSHGPPP